MAHDQQFLAQTMEMIPADVPRQRRAEVNILDRAQKGELPILDRIAETTPVAAVDKFEETYHPRYYEAMGGPSISDRAFFHCGLDHCGGGQAWIQEFARAFVAFVLLFASDFVKIL